MHWNDEYSCHGSGSEFDIAAVEVVLAEDFNSPVRYNHDEVKPFNDSEGKALRRRSVDANFDCVETTHVD